MSISACLCSIKKLLTSLVIVVPFICWFSAQGQTLQPYRYEREQKNSDDYFHVISLEEKGLALFRERDKFKNSNRIWELIFLDSTLQEKNSLELEIKERHKMIGYETSENNLYFLFRTGETNRNNLELIDISYKGKELERHLIKPDLDFRLTHFIKAGDNFVFGGYVSNESVLVIYEPQAKSLKVVPGFFQKDTELVDLRANENRTFNCVLINRNSRGERKMTFRTFDQTGKQLLEDAIPIDEDVSLQTGLTSTLEREDLIIAGTYGEKNAKQSNGFYTVSVNPFDEQKIRYVDFGQLSNFVAFLNDKRAERIKQNSKEANAEGRQPAFTSYVMPFRIIENKKGYFLLAEVYNPVNSSAMNTTNPYYYNPYYSPFGYNPWGYYYPGMSRMYRPYSYGPQNAKSTTETKTLETVVVALDEQGNIKWDQSLKLDDIRMPSLQQIGDFVVRDDKLYMLYKKESDLVIKSVVVNSDAATEHTEKIKTSHEGDIIRSEKETESGVRHWFGKSFYVWGYQTLRNTTKDNRVRDVFYINRVDPY
jgi:hypothetical protein